MTDKEKKEFLNDLDLSNMLVLVKTDAKTNIHLLPITSLMDMQMIVNTFLGIIARELNGN